MVTLTSLPVLSLQHTAVESCTMEEEESQIVKCYSIYLVDCPKSFRSNSGKTIYKCEYLAQHYHFLAACGPDAGARGNDTVT